MSGMKNRPMDGLANEVAKTKDCKDCGKPFDLTHGQLAWFREKFGESYAEPSRCPDCRQRRRDAKNNTKK